MGPIFNQKYPCKREAEGVLRQKRRKQCDHQAGTGVMSHKPRNAWSPQTLEEARDGFSPRAFEESIVLLTP